MSISFPRIIQGRLTLQLRDAGGGLVLAERRARNTVLRSGAELVASLFQGAIATPVNGMAVGLDPTPAEPPYETTALTVAAPDGTVLLQHPAVTLAADAITSSVDVTAFKVQLTVHGVIPPDRAVSTDPAVASVDVGEAALGVLAADGESLVRIYNRVVFEPIPKRRNQELVFYWEVDFPYGA